MVAYRQKERVRSMCKYLLGRREISLLSSPNIRVFFVLISSAFGLKLVQIALDWPYQNASYDSKTYSLYPGGDQKKLVPPKQGEIYSKKSINHSMPRITLYTSNLFLICTEQQNICSVNCITFFRQQNVSQHLRAFHSNGGRYDKRSDF